MNANKNKEISDILVVEDDSEQREIFARWINAMGHHCVVVNDGQQAVKYLKKGSCDLVVTDMLMPNMDGMELLRHIQREKKDLSVIVLTGHSKEFSFSEIIRAGACDVIEKPTGKDVLCAKINYALHTKNLKDGLTAEINSQNVLIDLLNLSVENKEIEELLHEFLTCIIAFPWLDLEPQGAVFLVDDNDPKMLVLKAHHNLATPLQIKCAKVPFGRCLCGMAALRGKTVFVGHVDHLHDNRFAEMSDHGHYCVPIMMEGNKLLGVFTLYIKAGAKQEEKVEKVLNAAANTLAKIINIRQNDETIIQHERRFQSMTENAGDAIILMDNHGSISFWNPAAERIFGYTSTEVLGKNLHSIIVPKRYQPQYGPGLEDFFRTGEGNAIGKTLEVSGLTKGGKEVPVELSLSALNVHGVWQAVGIIRDISERKKLEEEKEDLNVKLRQAHKMEAIGTLAGGIAHDFNNILGAIIGFADMAMDDVPPESQTHKDLHRILTAGNRAKDLVSQILTFSRQKEEEFVPIKIQSLLQEAMKLIRASIPMNIRIIQKIDAESDVVLADPTQVHQIIMNLCTNAYHAMRDRGGVLEVALKNCRYDSDRDAEISLTIGKLISGKYVKMTVSDTGCGMDKVVLERIFDPFYTTKPQGEGTGMGLSLVHGIVADHGGAIKVETTPEKGSVFDIYFPVFDLGKKEESITIKQIIGGNEHILLVDDEQALLEVSARKLTKWGYHVTARTSSVEALEAFKSNADQFDLVITDLAMPNMTGIDMAIEMLKVKPEVPIILSTGFADQSTIDHALHIGIKKIVNKPVALHEIALVIRQLLQGEINGS